MRRREKVELWVYQWSVAQNVVLASVPSACYISTGFGGSGSMQVYRPTWGLSMEYVSYSRAMPENVLYCSVDNNDDDEL